MPHTYIAVINRILQVIILAYIIGYDATKKFSKKCMCLNDNFDFSYIVLWKKGYQETQEPRGTSVIKVKGIGKVSGNDGSFYISKNLSFFLCFTKISHLKNIFKVMKQILYGTHLNMQFRPLYVNYCIFLCKHDTQNRDNSDETLLVPKSI